MASGKPGAVQTVVAYNPNDLPTETAPLKTTGQTIWLQGSVIYIKYSVLYYGFLGQKQIPVENVKTISWRDPGALMGGFLEIAILGECSPNSYASSNVRHQNLFRYPAAEIARWRNFKEWIEDHIRGSSFSKSLSVADEIEKLGELLNKGLLTEQEFASEKAKLLSR